MSTTIPQWPDPLSTWIKEAPKIEVHFSLRFSPRLEPRSQLLIPELEQRLCGSEAWSEIGLAITHNTHGTHTEPGFSTKHFITLELCRQINVSSAARHSRVPAALRNPPDIICPEGLPVVSLDAIELSLEFDSFPFTNDEFHELADLSDHTEELLGLHPQYESPNDLAMDWESRIPVYPEAFSEDEDIICEDDEAKDRNPWFETLYDLMDFGLQRLLISPTPNIPFVQPIGADDLRILRKLAPAIFNAEYREGMNQRAASIPIIADAVASMITNTSNPQLQRQSSYLPQDPTAWIARGLWGKAQAQLPRRKALKTQRRFCAPSINFASQAMATHDRDDFGDDDILEIDDNQDEFFEVVQTDTDHESDKLLFRSSSQSSFQDLDESTQTTLNSNHTSLSVASTPRTDGEMLLGCDSTLEEPFFQLET